MPYPHPVLYETHSKLSLVCAPTPDNHLEIRGVEGSQNPRGSTQPLYLKSWSRGESNPCPKAHSLSFYYHSPLSWVSLLTLFPRKSGNEQPEISGSFMIRPRAQSLTRVVSHIIDARIRKCECLRADEPLKRRHGQRLGCQCVLSIIFSVYFSFCD